VLGAEAALIVSVVGALGVAGGALGGLIGDRIGVVRGLVGGFFVTSAAFGFLLLAGGTSIFWAVALLFGFSWFGIGVLVPLLVSKIVPAEELGSSLGLLELVWAVGAGIGPALLAWIYDDFGTYVWGWSILGAISILAGCIAYRLTENGEQVTPADYVTSGRAEVRR
jgi:MFS family permease